MFDWNCVPLRFFAIIHSVLSDEIAVKLGDFGVVPTNNLGKMMAQYSVFGGPSNIPRLQSVLGVVVRSSRMEYGTTRDKCDLRTSIAPTWRPSYDRPIQRTLEGPTVIDPATQAQLKEAIADCIGTDQGVLEGLRDEIRHLHETTRQILPRSTTSISIVGTDGGNNQLQFDPFLVQLVRVVDSSNNEYCLEAVSPTTPIKKLNHRQLSGDGSPQTALGEMMQFLGVETLPELSHMIRPTDSGKPVSPSWVQVYRELVEWATLFAILKSDFGTDTLIVCDGLLRSKIFAKDLFHRLLQGMRTRIEDQWQRRRRHVYLAGVAKHSKVLSRYRLAMALEGVLQADYPAYVAVPRDVEERAYIWSEFARGDDRVGDEGEINKFVGGKMFLAKFGTHKRDPIWPVDIFEPQVSEAQTILGSLLADTINGFPVPHYPRCLQKAHENAALVEFDFEILQDFIYDGVRASLKGDASTLDVFQLQDADPSQKRYR